MITTYGVVEFPHAIGSTWLVTETNDGTTQIVCECMHDYRARFVADRLALCVGAGGNPLADEPEEPEPEPVPTSEPRCARCGRSGIDHFGSAHPFESRKE